MLGREVLVALRLWLGHAQQLCPPASVAARELIDYKTSMTVQQFRGGRVVKAHRLVYHSTLGLRVIQRREKSTDTPCGLFEAPACQP